MRLIHRIRQRVADWLRELRITALEASVLMEFDCGRHDLANEAWLAMTAEIAKRSPEQVARMERARGLR